MFFLKLHGTVDTILCVLIFVFPTHIFSSAEGSVLRGAASGLIISFNYWDIHLILSLKKINDFIPVSLEPSLDAYQRRNTA